jgi:DNA-binding response OmpR family regulator
MTKILMIDDDTEVLEINRKFFEEHNCDVAITDKAKDGIMLVKNFKPDCILLDVMMPEVDGLTLCREIRTITSVPVLFLSGKVSESDKIEGFEAGGDDYIEKPYSLREVYARIQVHVRRHSSGRNTQSSKMTITINSFTINMESHKLFYHDEEIIISNKEYDLMLFLAQNPNKLITFEEIGMKLWGSYIETDRRNVMVNVSRLRKKIEAQTGVDNLIETVWSKGYKLVKNG